MAKITNLPLAQAPADSDFFPIVQDGITRRASFGAFAAGLLHLLPDAFRGNPGPAGNVAGDLFQLKAALITNKTMLWNGVPFHWETVNAPYTPDEDQPFVTTVASAHSGYPASVGAWVRQGAESIRLSQGGNVEQALDARTLRSATVAGMLDLPVPAGPATCVVDGYHIAGDGGGGVFRWDDEYSDDSNHLTFFKPGSVGAWVRMIDGITVTPAMAGIPRTSTGVDHRAALQEVIDCPRFAFPDGFSCDFGGLLNLTTSNQVGHFGTARFKLLAGALAGTWGICVGKGWRTTSESAARVRAFPVDSVWYGGIFDGNMLNTNHTTNPNGVSGGDGGMIGIVAVDAVNCHWYGPKTRNWATDGIIIWDRHRRLSNHSTYCVLDGFHLHDPDSVGNARQGMSIISCKDAHVYNGRCNDTGQQGLSKPGAAGLDIEPNPLSELNKDTVNVRFHGRFQAHRNKGRGIMLHNPDQIVRVVFDEWDVADNEAADYQFAQSHVHTNGSIGVTDVRGRTLRIGGSGKGFAMTSDSTPIAWVNTLKLRELVHDSNLTGAVPMINLVSAYSELSVSERYALNLRSTAHDHAGLIVAGRFSADGARGAIRNVGANPTFGRALDITSTAERVNFGTLYHWCGRGVRDASVGAVGVIHPMDHTSATTFAGLETTSSARSGEYKILFPESYVIAAGSIPVSLKGNDAQVIVRARNISGNVILVEGNGNTITPDLIRSVGSSLIGFASGASDNVVMAGRIQNQTSSAAATDAATMGTRNRVIGCAPPAANVP